MHGGMLARRRTGEPPRLQCNGMIVYPAKDRGRGNKVVFGAAGVAAVTERTERTAFERKQVERERLSGCARGAGIPSRTHELTVHNSLGMIGEDEGGQPVEARPLQKASRGLPLPITPVIGPALATIPWPAEWKADAAGRVFHPWGWPEVVRGPTIARTPDFYSRPAHRRTLRSPDPTSTTRLAD